MITVALPVYNSSQIAWLALEGLSRQEKAPKWELIICEEDHSDKCMGELIQRYRTQLISAGCVSIKHLEPDRWVQLIAKWQMIGKAADSQSDVFLLQAADCYPHPLRLYQSYKAIMNGADWYNEGKGFFFDLGIKRLIVYDHNSMGYNEHWRTGLNMAFRTQYARDIPSTHLNSGIDNFLLRHCLAQKNDLSIVFEDPLSIGVDTNGANSISKFRITKFINPTPPFHPTGKNIATIGLPKDIADRLIDFELMYTNYNYQTMKKYLFIKSRNHYRRGDIHELSDVVAELYLKEGVVKPFDDQVNVTVKEDKTELITKEKKFPEVMTTKRRRTKDVPAGNK